MQDKSGSSPLFLFPETTPRYLCDMPPFFCFLLSWSLVFHSPENNRSPSYSKLCVDASFKGGFVFHWAEPPLWSHTPSSWLHLSNCSGPHPRKHSRRGIDGNSQPQRGFACPSDWWSKQREAVFERRMRRHLVGFFCLFCLILFLSSVYCFHLLVPWASHQPSNWN